MVLKDKRKGLRPGAPFPLGKGVFGTPVYNAQLTKVDINETRRYAGLARAARFPDALLRQACLDAQVLAVPRGIWQVYPYSPADGVILAPTPLRLSGANIANHLAGSVQVAVLAVTIGEAIEAEISRRFRQGDAAAALLLDAAGTTAVEAAADQVNALINREAAHQGMTATKRYSPGYGDWDITVQQHVVALAGGGAIGITVTASSMLIPRKSVTAVIGLKPGKPNGQPTCAGNVCLTCGQPNCLARRTSSQ
ncbi:Vitamin B12 dependent methionine synthase, activation domain [Sporolituus thermophilus DSM 23256]|uniref:Vitamin B12 dependent methionine synthase, activation domain n=1 Tax=Sporolituus thermophilus DSM 23256 TaxID=1123285 RepID=A0A1G7L3D0_9FIRM|nr:Vitamin B12 dependent methionine synthase, activation domain [Sporolituus thermophilus DSM 23256]